MLTNSTQTRRLWQSKLSGIIVIRFEGVTVILCVSQSCSCWFGGIRGSGFIGGCKWAIIKAQVESGIFMIIITYLHLHCVVALPRSQLGPMVASSPGLLIGGRGKEGLVSTACACAVIVQILNNPITYGYRLYTLWTLLR